MTLEQTTPPKMRIDPAMVRSLHDAHKGFRIYCDDDSARLAEEAASTFMGTECNFALAFAVATGIDWPSVQTYAQFYPRADGWVDVLKDGDALGWVIRPDGFVVACDAVEPAAA